MRPVLLLDMSIVVLLVRAAPRVSWMFLPWHQARKFQLMNSEPLSQSTPRNTKGSACSTSWMAARNRGLAAPQDRTRLGPSAVDVGHVQGVPELTRSGIARMRDQIDLGKPRNRARPSFPS